jgi:hypothetical protein
MPNTKLQQTKPGASDGASLLNLVFGRPQKAYAMPRLAFMVAVAISPGVLAGPRKLQESVYEATFHHDADAWLEFEAT